MDEGVTGGGVWMGVTGAGIWVSLNERCGVVLLEEGWVGAIEGWGWCRCYWRREWRGVIGGGGGVDIIGGGLDDTGCCWRRLCMKVGFIREGVGGVLLEVVGVLLEERVWMGWVLLEVVGWNWRKGYGWSRCYWRWWGVIGVQGMDGVGVTGGGCVG